MQLMVAKTSNNAYILCELIISDNILLFENQNGYHLQCTSE